MAIRATEKEGRGSQMMRARDFRTFFSTSLVFLYCYMYIVHTDGIVGQCSLPSRFIRCKLSFCYIENGTSSAVRALRKRIIS